MTRLARIMGDDMSGFLNWINNPNRHRNRASLEAVEYRDLVF
jgi:hypothetical protein